MRQVLLPLACCSALALLAGCSVDLGSCDMDAARTPYYDVNGNPSYGGQALVEQSCASGQCHISTAKGATRVGAPAGLNFDMNVSPTSSPTDPTILAHLRRGQRRVYDNREEVYDSVEGDWMPPGDAGKNAVIDKGYKDGDGNALPAIGSGAGKKILRNWLACGSPVVEAASAAADNPTCTGSGGSVGDICQKAMVDNTGGATWDKVYMSLIQGQACLACHNTGGTGDTAGKLDMHDMATAYANLVNVDTMGTGGAGGDCKDSGTKRVVPGDPDASNLIHKITGMHGADPVCGDAMPTSAGVTDTAVVQLVRDWITAGATETSDAADAGM